MKLFPNQWYEEIIQIVQSDELQSKDKSSSNQDKSLSLKFIDLTQNPEQYSQLKNNDLRNFIEKSHQLLESMPTDKYKQQEESKKPRNKKDYEASIMAEFLYGLIKNKNPISIEKQSNLSNESKQDKIVLQEQQIYFGQNDTLQQDAQKQDNEYNATIYDVGCGKGYLSLELAHIIQQNNKFQENKNFQRQKLENINDKNQRIHFVMIDGAENNIKSAEKEFIKSKFNQNLISYQGVHKWITIENYKDQIQSQSKKNIITGIHQCGNLSSLSINEFVKNARVNQLAIIGCCYNCLTERICLNSLANNPQFKSYIEENQILNSSGRFLDDQFVECNYQFGELYMSVDSWTNLTSQAVQEQSESQSKRAMTKDERVVPELLQSISEEQRVFGFPISRHVWQQMNLRSLFLGRTTRNAATINLKSSKLYQNFQETTKKLFYRSVYEAILPSCMIEEEEKVNLELQKPELNILLKTQDDKGHFEPNQLMMLDLQISSIAQLTQDVSFSTNQHQLGKRKRVKNVQDLDFKEYAKLISFNQISSRVNYDKMQKIYEDNYNNQYHKFQVFYILKALLSPLVEALIVLDRVIFLQEHGFENSKIIEIFEKALSTRNYLIYANKT
eukprot:403370042